MPKRISNGYQNEKKRISSGYPNEKRSTPIAVKRIHSSSHPIILEMLSIILNAP